MERISVTMESFRTHYALGLAVALRSALSATFSFQFALSAMGGSKLQIRRGKLRLEIGGFCELAASNWVPIAAKNWFKSHGAELQVSTKNI